MCEDCEKAADVFAANARKAFLKAGGVAVLVSVVELEAGVFIDLLTDPEAISSDDVRRMLVVASRTIGKPDLDLVEGGAIH